MKPKIVISCEHGGNELPLGMYLSRKTLESHKAYDKGALSIAKSLAQYWNVKLHSNTISRLAIDYNRSLDNQKLWKKDAEYLNDQDKAELIAAYNEYRNSIEKDLQTAKLHISIHSFTPVMNGVKRNCDFAVLFDPSRPQEKQIATKIKTAIQSQNISCRLNYPYKGTSDGITTYFRKLLPKDYIGLELEFNQKIVDNQRRIEIILEELNLVLESYVG